MVKLLLIFVIINCVFWTSFGVRISGSYFNDEYPDENEVANELERENEDQDTTNNKLVEACLIQVLTPSVSCILATMSKWGVSPRQLKTEVNHKGTCCAIWETSDCMLNNAKIHCTEEERTAFKAHMETQTALRNQKNCSHFQYESDSCNIEEDPIEGQGFPQHSFHPKPFQSNHVIELETSSEPTPQEKPKSDSLIPIDVDSDKPNLNLDSIDKYLLAKHILDRVQRITIHRMVIDFHPIKDKEPQTKQEINIQY